MRPATEYMISGSLNATRQRTPHKTWVNQSLPWWWFLFSHPHLLFAEITGSDIAARKKHSKCVISQPQYATRAWKVTSVRRVHAVLWGPKGTSLLPYRSGTQTSESDEEARSNKVTNCQLHTFIQALLHPISRRGFTVYKELHSTQDSDKLAKETQGKCHGNRATCHLPGQRGPSIVILIHQHAWENPVG